MKPILRLRIFDEKSCQVQLKTIKRESIKSQNAYFLGSTNTLVLPLFVPYTTPYPGMG